MTISPTGFNHSINPFLNTQAQGYHQARVTPSQGVPNTLPRVYGMPNVEDMEAALAFLEGNTKVAFAPEPKRVQPTENRGQAWEGFSVPVNNGTGELSPKYAKGEKLLDFKA